MATSVPRPKSKNGIGRVTLEYPERDIAFSSDDVRRVELEKIYRAGEGEFGQLIFGENLRVLATLADDPKVTGKVDLIYIDPPYATGGVFNCREQNGAYDDTLTGGSYLEFLRTRLIISRELMSQTASIFLHLDERYVFHAKLLLDEIFGPSMFRNMIVRKKCNSKNYTTRRLGNVADYILWYSKSKDYIWNTPTASLTPEFTDREYPYFDSKSRRRYKRVPLHAPGTRNGESGQVWRGKLPPEGKHWQYRPETLDEMDKRGEIYWSRNGNPRRKVFLDESRGLALQDIWVDVKDAHNQNCTITGYPTEKNLTLVQRIVEAASNQNGLVLDFFSGSATIAEAASRLGRRWICVDNSKLAIEKSLERLIRGRRLMGNFVSEDFAVQKFRFGPIPHSWSFWIDLDVAGFSGAASLRRLITKLNEEIPGLKTSNLMSAAAARS